MRQRPPIRLARPDLEILEVREVPTGSIGVTESFDTTAPGQLPAGWSQWSSGAPAFAVGTGRAVSGSGLAASSPTASGLSARAWVDQQQPADLRASVSVFADTMIPAQVFARGKGVSTATPSYYAASLTRGLKVQLSAVVNGTTTVLGQINSASWFEAKWARMTLQTTGPDLRVQVQRSDDGRFLDATGQWRTEPTWAIIATDSNITGSGYVGLARPSSYTGTLSFDDFRVQAPLIESFDSTPAGKLPEGWSQWSSGAAAFAVGGRAVSGSGLQMASPSASGLSARTWPDLQPSADVSASVSVYLDTAIPAQEFVRGQAVNTSAPTYYAASINRGLKVQLSAVVNGVGVVLGQVTSATWFEAKWARVTLQANGTGIRVQVQRLDDSRFLDANGVWRDEPTWAISVTDTSISGQGYVGLARPASYAGTVSFDDFRAGDVEDDRTAPEVAIRSPSGTGILSGTVRVQAAASDNVGVTRVAYLVDGVERASQTSPSFWDFDTTTASNGSHVLTVQAFDAAGNVGLATLTVQTSNNVSPLPPPVVPQHYSHIRLAQLAYGSIGPVEQQQLRDSIDLVIVDVPVKDRPGLIDAASPNTPQLLYTNLSNVYTTTLTDWLQYADAHNLSRESAFYHARKPIAYSGAGASTSPVNWFWRSYRVGSQTTDVTTNVRGTTAGGIALPGAGETLDLGQPDRFGEINLDVATAGTGWSGVLEYVTAVDSTGKPTAWKTLPLLSDATSGLTGSGRITFDPPKDWVTAALAADSPRLFYVRVRPLTTGTAPVAKSILGRDYVNANGTTKGTIPVFDSAADADGDGYLNDTEYAKRAAGKDARFVYESRVFTYGPMRFTTNPTDAGFRAWAVDYQLRNLKANPLLDGLFIDNSLAVPNFATDSVLEPTAAYSSDYASLVGAVSRGIAPKWVLVNTAGGNASTDATVRQAAGYFEEFSLRPMAHNYVQFEQLASLIERRAALTSPSPFAIIDSNPQGGSISDPRMQIGTLAYYYLLADPKTTFLDVNGGASPGSSWSQHWIPAATYDVGQPQGQWSLFAYGADPSSLSYHVYQRSYSNALVLYKPLSYGNNVTGTLGDNTATTHQLGGEYYLLKADGTLGAKVTSVTLRNGEGAILIRA